MRCLCIASRDQTLQLSLPEWVPDFGPAQFVPQWGATVTGARKFLVAYNVNVLGTKEQAHRIALNVREQGRGPGQVCLGPLICLTLKGASIAHLKGGKAEECEGPRVVPR